MVVDFSAGYDDSWRWAASFGFVMKRGSISLGVSFVHLYYLGASLWKDLLQGWPNLSLMSPTSLLSCSITSQGCSGGEPSHFASSSDF